MGAHPQCLSDSNAVKPGKRLLAAGTKPMRLSIAATLSLFLLAALAPSAQAICADLRQADGDCQTTDIRLILGECGVIVGACLFSCRGLYVGPCGDGVEMRAVLLP